MTALPGPIHARRIASEHYGLDVEAEPLDGERDLNFRLRERHGAAYVLKLHDRAADRDELDLQDAALEHLAAQPAGPLAPHLIPTLDGRRWALDDGRVIRLLSWIDGRPWADAGPHDDARLADLGAHVARVDRALAGFRHPAMRRELLWNLTSAPRVAELADHVDAQKRPVVEAAFQRYADFVAARLDALPHQVIHNDANERNILVDDRGDVAGVIDFGDVVWSARVCGVAVAGAYAMQGHADPLRAVAPLVHGYDQITPLTMGELGVLFDLMRTRLAMSICMSAWQHARDPQNEYLLISQDGVWTALEAAMGVDAELAHFCLRDACGYAPNPAARRVRQHFESGAERPVSVVGPASVLTPYGALDGAGGVQLGVGLGVAPGALVRAPLEGTVAATDVTHDQHGVVLLQHRTADGTPFWTLFGYLDEGAARRLTIGAGVEAGDVLGTPASARTGPSRLHLQLLSSLAGGGVASPAIAPAAEVDVWQSISEDPALLLGCRAGAAPHPSPTAVELVRRRRTNLSRALSLSYAEPLHIVRGKGPYLYDAEGRPWLDLVNNVCHVGHCHPRVVEAGRRQMGTLNTNTRYLHEHVVTHARRLVATLPDPLRVIFFVNSGSEANDLALRLAFAHTNRRDVLVLDHAYHGHLSSLIALSPYKFNRAGGEGRPATTHVCELPDSYRGRLRDSAATGRAYAASVQTAVAELTEQGRAPAAFFAESLQSCGGQIVYPDGYLAAAFAAVRAAGAVCVADEVQVGLGRVGRRFWGFELQGVVPDIVTMGKPMGNGHPVAAVATTPEVATSFETGMEYFNTFAGNPVSAAIGLAVLDVLRDEGLQAHAAALGSELLADLGELATRHPLIGDVRGEGLFIGIELSSDREQRRPATAQAQRVKEAVKAQGVLLSTDGPDDNVLKVKPPLVVTRDDCDLFLEALDRALTAVEHRG